MVLFTSAAPGKKAAPKAAPRRRPQPQPALPAQQQSTPAPTPSDAPGVVLPSSSSSSIIDVPPAEQAEQPVLQTQPEGAVERAQTLSVPEVAIQAVAAPTPTPVVLQSPPPTPIALSGAEPVAAAAAEAAQPTPPPTQAQSAPRASDDTAITAVESQSALHELSTETSVAGAEQRFEDYYVAQGPGAESAEPETQAAPVEPLQTRKSKSTRRVSAAQVPESASSQAPKAKAATKRRARAAPASTSDAPRPAKRSRRAELTEPSTTSSVEHQHSSTVSEPEAAQDGDTGAAHGDETPARSRRKQPSRRTAPGKTKATVEKGQTAGKRRKVPTKSLETIVDSDDENEVTDTVATPTSEQEQEQEEHEDPESAAEVEEGRAARQRQKRVRTEPKPKKPKLRKRRIRRSPVEGEEEEREEDSGSDPELHEIDPNAVSMWDLSHDAFHGKMSERGKAMEVIDWEAEKAKRRAAADLIASGGQPGAAEGATDGTAEGVVPSTEGPNGTAVPAAENAEGTEQTDQIGAAPDPPAPEPQAAEAELAPAEDDEGDGIGFIVDDDGNIIEDPTTLVVNRQAEAMAAAAADRPVEEINDLTTLNNRTTWINTNRREPTDRVPLWKWKSDPWSEEQTDEFYDALRMFGTDFLIISKMFPPKTRRMIKAKFTREEKLDPQRINRALNGEETRKLDLDYYAQKTARDISVFTKYDSLKDAQDKIGDEMKERHAELATAAAQEEQREAEKRIQETLQKSKQVKKARKGKKGVGGFGGFGGGGGPDAGD